MKLYLVMHHEIMFRNGSHIIDDIVSHVATTMAKAIQFLKGASVEEYSCWEIVEWETDELLDTGLHMGWYGRRGGKLKECPYQKMVEAYQKINPESFSVAAREDQIRVQAYLLWEEAGRPWGREDEFWNRAKESFEVMTETETNCLRAA